MCEAKERLSSFGANALTDNELLNVILGRSSSKDFRRPLDLINLSSAELVLNGMTRTEALKVKALFEFSQRLWITSNKDLIQKLDSAEAVAIQFSRLKYLDQENFCVAFLDFQKRLIAEETMTIGTNNSSLVSVREVMIKALSYKAVGVVLIHNHPGGNSDPSAQDIQVTNQIQKACETLGINLLDHVIISKNDYYSFKERFIL